MNSSQSFLASTKKSRGAGYLKEMAENGYSPNSIGLFHKIMVPHLLQSLKIDRQEVVLDIGAAQGHVAISARTAGYEDIVAIDIDPYNFQLFEEEHGIRCELCDVSIDALPFGDCTVGAILCFHLIEHLHLVEHFLTESYRVLRTGGALVLVTPDWRKQYKTFWRDPTHIHPYDKESLARVARMCSFKKTEVSAWGPRYGTGRLKAYRWFPKLGMIGADLLGVALK